MASKLRGTLFICFAAAFFYSINSSNAHPHHGHHDTSQDKTRDPRSSGGFGLKPVVDGVFGVLNFGKGKGQTNTQANKPEDKEKEDNDTKGKEDKPANKENMVESTTIPASESEEKNDLDETIKGSNTQEKKPPHDQKKEEKNDIDEEDEDDKNWEINDLDEDLKKKEDSKNDDKVESNSDKPKPEFFDKCISNEETKNADQGIEKNEKKSGGSSSDGENRAG